MTPVITGVPRSGTHYLATLLGWNHEVYYRPGCPGGEAPRPEVSWAAVPFVNPAKSLVIHLVRNPWQVVASNIHRDWLKTPNSWGKFAHRHAGTWNLYEFYLRWFAMAEKLAHSTIRLEDVAHLGPPTNRFGDPAPVEVPAEYLPEFNAIAERYGYPTHA